MSPIYKTVPDIFMNKYYLPYSKLPEICFSGTLPLVPKILIFMLASVPAKGTLEVSTIIVISEKIKCDMKARSCLRANTRDSVSS